MTQGLVTLQSAAEGGGYQSMTCTTNEATDVFFDVWRPDLTR